MSSNQGLQWFQQKSAGVEWRLLIFLVLLMDVKLIVKLVALLLVIFIQPDFKFGFKWKASRLPLFYPVVIGIAITNFILYKNFSVAYLIVFFTAILFWAASILTVHQLKLFVERTDLNTLHNTLLAFFVLNIIFSAGNLLYIFAEIGLRNPFLYQGEFQKYFINTGDHIKGITFDISTTNAVINCFGIVYFLHRKKYGLVIACMLTLLLTASNFSNIILILVFAGIFLFNSAAEHKSIIVVCSALLVIFFAKISPQNNNYIDLLANKFLLDRASSKAAATKPLSLRETADSLLTPENRKEKIALLFLDSLERERLSTLYPVHEVAVVIASDDATGISKKPEIPKDSIHTAGFQWKRDTTEMQRKVLHYIGSDPSLFFEPYKTTSVGKLQAFKQSLNFLKEHPSKIALGTGPGNFSSKLAFRATGLNIAGGFPKRFTYRNTDFLNHHFGLYAFFFTRNAESHSIIHNPASVYDQVMTEYGFIGLMAFVIFYIGYFLKNIKMRSYALPLLVIMLAAFMVDYWFEQLSIVLLFELMMFINRKENLLKATDE